MPILWRYALHSYLRVFVLTVATFISVLIVARFKDIARFTALTGDWPKTGLFIVYQIPSILPIAIPLSALISSLLLFQRLSRTQELTAWRSSGLSLSSILAPLLLSSALLCIFNFSICAEISPYCRREGKTLIFQKTSQNPLLLLQRQNLVNVKHAYLDMRVKDDETTKDLTLIVKNDNTQRLSLLTARKLRMKGEELLGDDLAIVSYLNADESQDTLVIENQASMSTHAGRLSESLKKKSPHLDVNALSLKSLRFYKKTKHARVEILRRISLSLAVFSFTFLGAVFGIEQGRIRSVKNILCAIGLTLTVLMSYLLGKGLKDYPLLALFAFLIPHPFIWLASLYRLRQINRGTIS